jgi:HlyD family secretion protein
VDAYPGVPFAGTIRQVRLAPINVQNVVTYNVVVGVDNKDLRLKPGMTANVSIVVAQRDNVLKVPNAALRFVPPQPDQGESRRAEGRPAKSEGRGRAMPAGNGGPPARLIWKQGGNGELTSVSVQTGISDGSSTEIVSDAVAEGDQVIVGIEQPHGAKKSGDLPPGFGSSGGQRRPRDRGI